MSQRYVQPRNVYRLTAEERALALAWAEIAPGGWQVEVTEWDSEEGMLADMVNIIAPLSPDDEECAHITWCEEIKDWKLVYTVHDRRPRKFRRFDGLGGRVGSIESALFQLCDLTPSQRRRMREMATATVAATSIEGLLGRSFDEPGTDLGYAF